MAGEDLVFAGVASALLRNARPATASTATPPTGSSPTVSLTQSQLEQLSGAVAEGIRSVEFPAPVVNVPAPVVNIPQNLTVTLPDAQIDRLAQSISVPAEKPLDILNRSVQADFTGAAIHALVSPSATGSYPNLIRLASIQFIQDVSLVGIVLSASLLNTGTEPMGLFVARDTGLIINFATPTDPTVRANDIYLSILTHNNSTVGTNAPASRTSSIGFSPKSGGILFKSASSISIYGCSQNIASALLTGILSVYYIPVPMDTGA